MAGARQFPQGSNNDGVGARQWPPEAAGGGGGAVTPGSGSSGFTNPRIIMADAGGALDDGPAALYTFADTTGSIFIRIDQNGAAAPTVAGYTIQGRTVVGEAGGFLAFVAGTAGAANAGTAGGVGGTGTVSGGGGGAGSAAQVAGAGGLARILGGAPGANGGGGGGVGGSVWILPAAGTGAAADGDIVLGDAGALIAGYETRYVRVGPASGSIPLLINRTAPLAAEILSVSADTDALSLLGRVAIGSWVATDELNIAHVDNRASATGYVVRAGASGAASLINVPNASGLLYLTCGGGVSQGWRIGDGVGSAFHLAPLVTNANDLGTSSLMIRDAYLGRDVIALAGAAHQIYVAAAAAGTSTTGGALTARGGVGAAATAGVAAASGGLGTFAGGNGGAGATGRAPGSGGGAYVFGGDAGARVDTGNPSGGGVEVRAGNGLVAGAGGTVEIVAGSSGTGGTAGNVTIDVQDADGVFGGIFIGGSTSQRVGFYGVTPVAQQTGVAVSAAGIHAALVALGLIT